MIPTESNLPPLSDARWLPQREQHVLNFVRMYPDSKYDIDECIPGIVGGETASQTLARIRPR